MLDPNKVNDCLKCRRKIKGRWMCPKCAKENESVYVPKSAPNPAGVSSFSEPTNFEVRKVGDT